MPTIPRQPDVVFIYWTRNPLRPRTGRRIQRVTVIGSANPCTTLLAMNRAYGPAARCLLRNGFMISCQKNTTSVSGFTVFTRSR